MCAKAQTLSQIWNEENERKIIILSPYCSPKAEQRMEGTNGKMLQHYANMKMNGDIFDICSVIVRGDGERLFHFCVL